MDAFKAPVEAERPAAPLTKGEQATISYLHSTIAPKVVTGVAVLGFSLFNVLMDLFSVLTQGSLDPIRAGRLAAYALTSVAGLAAVVAGAQALRTHDERVELIIDALDVELLFWQIFTCAIACFYLIFAFFMGYILLIDASRP